MTFPCPSGHDSDESDYCSVCGSAIPAGAAAAPAPLPHAGASPTAPALPRPTGSSCPVCGEPRVSDARFCEVCRYDFVARKAGPPPAAPAQASPAPANSPSPAPPAEGPRWRLVVTVDASLDTEPDPAASPPNEPERMFPVEQDELLVGRRDDRQQIRPAVPLHDPGASRRHAKVMRNADGSLSLHDLGSTNGTKINGQDVVSGALRALAEGDEITLGRWTRIRVEARK
jgi:hypothetical protein